MDQMGIVITLMVLLLSWLCGGESAILQLLEQIGENAIINRY